MSRFLFLTLLSFLFWGTGNLQAQVANDDCATALSLGSLTTPRNCNGSPNAGLGTPQSFNLTNVGATPVAPYSSLLGCNPAGNMASPADDVWYSFTATGTELDLQIAGAITDPNVGIWEGACGSLVGRGCAIGTGGNLNTTFTGLFPGTTYYLQISGGGVNDQGNFTLTLQNNVDCDLCVINSTLTATPAPNNGTYQPGTVVTFCYEITEYNQANSNWMHGVVPSFGAGWDISSLGGFVPSASCDGQGSWDWENSVTSSFSGNSFGPGFFYERSGNPNNPGDNFGDNCSGTGTPLWRFCWTITTSACPPGTQGQDLGITINTLADGESGSWGGGFPNCSNDPDYQFSASLTCCEPPIITVVNVTCNGGSDGSITATGQGSGNWDYVWRDGGGTVIQTNNNVGGSNTLSGIPAGTYTVEVTDRSDGCVTTTTIVVTEPATGVVLSLASSNNVSCFGANDGTATVSASGGTGPYTYGWNTAPPQAGATATGLGGGTFMAYVVDAGGCVDSLPVTITEPPAIVVVIDSSHNVTCNGAADGEAFASASGGTGGITLSWNSAPVQTGGTATNLPPGTYTVTATDGNGCTNTAQVTITEPPVLTATITASTNVSCNGQSNGSATVAAGGGTPGYTFSWNSVPVQNTATATNLPAGTYTATVTDANGCTETAQVTITEPPVLTATITASTNISCNGANDGSATAAGGGGTPGYSYSWNTAPVQNTATATNLPAGTFTVTVTDANGCTETAQVTITEPPVLTATITASSNVSCNGANDGSATAGGGGGTPGYTYSWNTAPVQNTATATNLPAGTFTVTVTDANGCTETAQVTITEPPVLTATITASTNVTCNGANDGSATAAGGGGTPGYSYSWNSVPVQNTATATNLPAGTFTVTVTDANGCTETAQITITEPPVVTATITASTNVSCNGLSDGSATVAGGGGTPGYSYSWNSVPVQNTATATNLPAGTYTATVTDANGCTETAQVTITEPPVLTASITASTNISCNGANDGSATAAGGGGTPGYSYSWNTVPVQNTATASNLPAGTFTVTVTDANGCTETAQVTITEPTPIALATSNTPATCGNNDGTATVSPSGGTPGYTFAWNTAPVQTTATASNLVAGAYQVVVTDANGCQDSVIVNVSNLAAPVAAIDSSHNVSCNGAADGDAYASSTGGTAPISFSWNTVPVQNTAVATNLPAGTWTVTVTDGNGCTSTAQVTITEPPVLTATITASTNVSCNGLSDGSATVAGGGGTPGYSYSWNSVPVQNTATATNLPAGTYTATVTDANGCTETAQVTITEPPVLTASITASTNISCNGANDGSATAAGGGGTPGYSYSWNTVPVQNTATASNLPAGTFTVTVTDANGCTETAQVTITEPTPIALATSNTPATCGNNDGTATVSPSGGTPGYTFAWNTAPVQTTATASNLVAGAYQVVVTDANGCQDSVIVNVNNLAAPVAAIDSSHNVSCNGAADGDAYASSTGGTAPISFSWNTVPVQNTAVATNLPAGTWTVTVTDGNGCTSTAQVTITEPPVLTATITASTNVSCNGLSDGSATVAGGGGTPGYTYSWNSVPVQNTATATNLPAGTYTATVTDANGCTETAQVTITEPPVLTASITASTNISCNGANDGSATAAGGGGTPGYSYSWNTVPVQNTATASNLPAGTFTVTVTDANGCTETAQVTITEPTPIALATSNTPATCGNNDGTATVSPSGGTPGYTFAWNTAPVQTTATASNLAAGAYQVVVTDANGCQDSVIVNVNNLAAPVAAIDSSHNVSCNGAADGDAYASSTGGTAPISFSWNTVPVQNTAVATNLPPGTWTVTVTDGNGCTSTAQVTITEPPAIVAVIDSSHNVSCNGLSDGDAYASATGGIGTITYSWNTVPVQNTPVATNLPAGTYTVTATDSNGCTATAQVTITEPAVLTATITASSDPSCNGGNDGSATAAGGGGTPGYTYSWNTVPVQTTATASNLTAGTYTVTVTDANGCTETAQITLTDPTAISLSTSNTPATCGNNDGTATVTPSGGTPGYTFAWNTAPVQTAATATNLAAGAYQVVVTDANGCQDSVIVNVNNLAAPVAVIDSSHNVSCNGAADGDAYASSTGGTAPISFSWNTVPVQNTAVATNLPPGTWTVTVTDGNGCTSTAQVTITEPPAIIAVIDSSHNVSCNGLSDGDAYASATGGIGTITYSWNTVPVQNTPVATNLPAGTYTVTATDSNGCTATAQVTITEPAVLTATITASSDPSCNGGNDGSATAAGGGGTPGYTYSWNTVPVQTTATASNLTAGTYTVTVTDANGCTETAQITLTDPTAISLSTSNTPATCGNNDGTATVTPSGGTPGYAFAWNTAPVQTTATATNLVAGAYQVVVTDANGCQDSITVNVANLAAPVAAIDSSHNVSCNGGADGEAFASSTGGTAPISFSWNTVPVQNTAVATGLAPGTWTVTVTDGNGCTSTAQVTITEPTPVVAAIDSTQDVSCNAGNDGIAFASASGGTPPYTYAWNTIPVQTGPVASGLAAGTWWVVVTDSNGCVDSVSATIGEPTPVVAAVTGFTNPLCVGSADGTADASASGGTPGYTYSWLTTPAQTGPQATGLMAGTYQVVATDTNGCMDTASVTLVDPPALVLATSSSPASCGNADGSVSVTASGGTPGYTYSWNSSPIQTTATATNLVAGTYMVTVTDTNGCSDTASVTIIDLLPPVAAIDSSMDALCNGSADGMAWASATGGSGTLSYTWNTTPVQTGPSASGLAAGTYQVIVSDTNGCADSISVTIGEPTALALTGSSSPAACGGSDGSASVAVTGGTPGYTYSWNSVPVQTTSTASNLASGTYQVVVTDSNGCADSVSVTVNDLNPPVATISGVTDVSCFGAADGMASVAGTSGTPPYTYSWNTVPVQTTPTVIGLPAGTYIATVTDSVGCSDSDTIVITQPDTITVSVLVDSVSCFGLSDGSVTLTVAGGTPAYDIQWGVTPPQSGPVLSGMPAGTYGFTIDDLNGCTYSDSVSIYEPPAVVAAFITSPALPATLDLSNASVLFTNNSQNASIYDWDFGDGNGSVDINPSHTYTLPGTFCITLIAANDSGCADTAEVCAFEIIQLDLEIPNTFTPNGDGTNDFFEIIGLGQYPNNRLEVFNRWGNLVYEKDQYNNDWNGTNFRNGQMLPDGGYFFIFYPNSEDEENVAGEVVIFR